MIVAGEAVGVMECHLIALRTDCSGCRHDEKSSRRDNKPDDQYPLNKGNGVTQQGNVAGYSYGFL